MSFQEFSTKNFGGGIKLPLGYLLGEISDAFDLRLGANPSIGRSALRLPGRDIVIVRGENHILIGIGSGTFRHLPFRETLDWAKAMTPDEPSFVQKVSGPGRLPSSFSEELLGPLNFTQPQLFLLPWDHNGTAEKRRPFVELVADALLEQEIARQVMAGKADESAPSAIADSLARFRRDFPEPIRTAFVMMQFTETPVHQSLIHGIEGALAPHGIRAIRADYKEYHEDLFSNILTYMHGCVFGIAVFERIEADEFNPNVSLEVGYMLALGKPVCLLKERTLRTLHTDLVGKLYRQFDAMAAERTIEENLTRWLRDRELVSPAAHRLSTQLSRTSAGELVGAIDELLDDEPFDE